MPTPPKVRINGLKDASKYVEAQVFSPANDVLSRDLRIEQVLLKLIETGEDTDLVTCCFGLLQRQYKQAFELNTALTKVWNVHFVL